MKFKVLRRHQGDKLYEQGDTREAVAADVAHLVSARVLAPISAPKADRKPSNKNAPKLTNKAS